MRRFVLLLAVGALVALAGVARVSARAPAATERAECEALGGGALASERVRVRTARGVPGCGDDRDATRTFLALDRRLGTLDPALRPGRVEIDLIAAPGRFEARPERGALVVSRAELGASATVWLHELAHLRAAGPRPSAGAGAHLALAIDEAYADYFAAAVSGEPLVGSGHAAARDLSRAPRVLASEWALLGFSRFDPHRFGWALAGAFWRREPRAGALLADLAVCLSGDALRQATTPAGVLHALAERCPARSRSVIAACLREWAPAELSARPDDGGRDL